MSGGSIAQLAFYYQNLFFISRLFDAWENDSKILTAKDEQKIDFSNQNGPELDFIFDFETYSDYYEVKSGLSFTDCKKDIVDVIKNFFSLHQNENDKRFWIIIDINYKEKISDYIKKINTVKKTEIFNPRSSHLLALAREVGTTEHERFFNFCHKLTIEPIDQILLYEYKLLEKLRQKVTVPIGGIEPENLIREIYHIIIESLNTNGSINMSQVSSLIAVWAAKNLYISQLCNHASDHLGVGNDCWARAKTIAEEIAKDFVPSDRVNPFRNYSAISGGENEIS